MAVRLAVTALLVLAATVAAQEPEGAWGVYVGRPVGNVSTAVDWIGTQGADCPGFVIGRGKVNAAAHEWEDGSFNVSEVTITMPRGAVALLRAKDLDGQEAELVLRPIPQRIPERLNK